VSLGSQFSNLFFVGYHGDVSVQISSRGKYKGQEILGMPSEQFYRLSQITTSLLLNILDHHLPPNPMLSKIVEECLPHDLGVAFLAKTPFSASLAL